MGKSKVLQEVLADLKISTAIWCTGATIAFIALRGQERETRTDQKVGWAPEEDGGWVG